MVDEGGAGDRTLTRQDLEEALGKSRVQRVLREPERGEGVVSAGLRRTALPAASAGAVPQAAIGIGKFQGAITATTPSGSWKVTFSPPATGIWAPLRRSTPPAA